MNSFNVLKALHEVENIEIFCNLSVRPHVETGVLSGIKISDIYRTDSGMSV